MLLLKLRLRGMKAAWPYWQIVMPFACDHKYASNFRALQWFIVDSHAVQMIPFRYQIHVGKQQLKIFTKSLVTKYLSLFWSAFGWNLRLKEILVSSLTTFLVCGRWSEVAIESNSRNLISLATPSKIKHVGCCGLASWSKILASEGNFQFYLSVNIFRYTF